MSSRVTISFFGSLADGIGRSVDVELPATGCTIAQLRAHLSAAHPGYAAELTGPGTRACAGDRIVAEDHPVRPGDQLEFLPPLSGG
jgi:molybdopterin converting factor small subunit